MDVCAVCSCAAEGVGKAHGTSDQEGRLWGCAWAWTYVCAWARLRTPASGCNSPLFDGIAHRSQYKSEREERFRDPMDALPLLAS